VRADGVVVAGKPVPLSLEFDDRAGGGLAGEPFLQGLTESLDLAAGLGMVGAGVPEADVQGGELDLQGDPAAAARGAGEDRAVIRQHRGGQPPAGGRVAEHCDHVGGLKGGAGGGGGQQPGMIVDDVEDLRGAVAGQLPVGDVQLPALVGLVSLEPHTGVVGVPAVEALRA
jgi:hypothetical protein